jgi:hypothetical protein
LQLRYEVAAQAIERDGKKYTLIEVIDESECRNKWRINPAGKAHALAGLLQTPLLGPPEHGHGAIDIVGRPVDFESNFHTKVLYEIPDVAHWMKVRSGEWQAVSPQLTFLKAHYEGDTLVIDDWRFDHVAFVERGAFPNARVKSTCEDNPALCGFSKAVTAALNESHGLEPEGSKPRQDVAAYSNNRQGDREKTGGHPTGGVIVKNTNQAATNTLAAADAWNTADAPDKFFAIVPDAAKGPNGNKSLRKIPLASVQKKDLDEAIIANALARLPQTNLPTGFTQGNVLQAICQAAKSVGYGPPSCQELRAQGGLTKEVDACMTCDHEKTIAELTEKNKTLEAELNEIKTKTVPALQTELKTVKAENESLKAKPVEANAMMATLQEDVKNLKAENATLKAWKIEKEEAEHMNRVQAVLDLRVKAGILDSKTVQAAADSLKKLPNEALEEIRKDLEAVQGKFESLPGGPKAKLIPSSVGAQFDPKQPTVGDLVGKKPGEA